METIFKEMAKALQNKDEALFRRFWHDAGYTDNLVGSSGLAGQRVFAQGSRKGWYMRPQEGETAVQQDGIPIVPCDIWSHEKQRAVDMVYVAVVGDSDQWLVLGAGEDREQVNALAARYLAGEFNE